MKVLLFRIYGIMYAKAMSSANTRGLQEIYAFIGQLLNERTEIIITKEELVNDILSDFLWEVVGNKTDAEKDDLLSHKDIVNFINISFDWVECDCISLQTNGKMLFFRKKCLVNQN